LISDVSYGRALAVVGFALGLGLFEIGQELLKSRLQSLAFAAASITRACVAFLLCLVAASLGGGGLGQLAMVALTYFITATIFAAVIWRGPMASFDVIELRQFARFGVPITVSGFVFAIHAALDRMLVFYLMGDAAAGYYGASADLVRQIILIPATSIAAATIPLAVRTFASGGEQEARRHLELSFEILLAVIIPAVVGFALTSNFVASIVLGSEYRETALQILPILAFAWLFQSITQSYVHVSFHLAKRPFLVTLQGIGMLLANLVTMPILTVRYGLPGAAWALVITELFGMGLGWFLARRAFSLPFNAWHVARICLATLVMGLVLAGLKLMLPTGWVSFCIIVAAGCATYAAAALVLDIAGVRKSLGSLRHQDRVAVSGQII
jgi:O-antigen/teichoic acid export membrane protein